MIAIFRCIIYTVIHFARYKVVRIRIKQSIVHIQVIGPRATMVKTRKRTAEQTIDCSRSHLAPCSPVVQEALVKAHIQRTAIYPCYSIFIIQRQRVFQAVCFFLVGHEHLYYIISQLIVITFSFLLLLILFWFVF